MAVDISLEHPQLEDPEAAEAPSTSYAQSQPLTTRLGSWTLVPPRWAHFNAGCDFCNAQNAPRFALLVAVLTVVIFASQTLTPGKVEVLMNWLDEDPLRGSICFVLLLIAAHLVAFPGAVFALAAGAVFGVVLGSILVWLGTVVGQTLAFCMGRFLLRSWVKESVTKRFPKWPAIDAAVSKEGWKLIALLRLSPIIPWNLLNYAVSVTGIPFLAFALSSAVSIIPWSTTLVYFGSLARSMADIFDGQVAMDGPLTYVVYGVSGVGLIIVVGWTTAISRRAIKEALLVSNSGGQEIVEELDALALMAASPRGDPMSPSRWSQPMGWTRVPPLEPEPEAVVNLPKHVMVPYAERPQSPVQDRRMSCLPVGRRLAVGPQEALAV